jgi:mannosyl-glycoprotein endo-beta-N-acetylglucosaminidase
VQDLQSVWNWNPALFSGGESIAQVPLRPRTAKSKEAPKVLCCHDMMGGYTSQDGSPEGGTDADIYRIYDWHLLDIFVYFSHNMVTIPPPGWTNAAHRNGTQSLGTFILEWEAGAATSNEIFASVEFARKLADRLIAVATYVTPPPP